MDIQKNEALIAEIEQFKEQALKMHIVKVLADTYQNSDLFDHHIDENGFVFWMKAQAWQLWVFWQAAKAQAVPEGFVLVEIKDLRDVISNAGDAMMNEETSSVYDRTGEPSTWFDHYTVAEKRVLKAIEAQEQKG